MVRFEHGRIMPTTVAAVDIKTVPGRDGVAIGHIHSMPAAFSTEPVEIRLRLYHGGLRIRLRIDRHLGYNR